MDLVCRNFGGYLWKIIFPADIFSGGATNLVGPVSAQSLPRHEFTYRSLDVTSRASCLRLKLEILLMVMNPLVCTGTATNKWCQNLYFPAGNSNWLT